jgi:hypothetical protein
MLTVHACCVRPRVGTWRARNCGLARPPRGGFVIAKGKHYGSQEEGSEEEDSEEEGEKEALELI